MSFTLLAVTGVCKLVGFIGMYVIAFDLFHMG